VVEQANRVDETIDVKSKRERGLQPAGGHPVVHVKAEAG